MPLLGFHSGALWLMVSLLYGTGLRLHVITLPQKGLPPERFYRNYRTLPPSDCEQSEKGRFVQYLGHCDLPQTARNYASKICDTAPLRTPARILSIAYSSAALDMGR